MSRRTFLFASLAIVATPLMARIREYLAATGEPLLVPPETADHVLYVNKDYGNIISLDHTMDEDPELMRARGYAGTSRPGSGRRWRP